MEACGLMAVDPHTLLTPMGRTIEETQSGWCRENFERLTREGSVTKLEDGTYYVNPYHNERLLPLGENYLNATKPVDFDPVDRPEHYNSHPSGVECVQITEHMTCMIGCAIKYLWRNGLKAGADADEDLRKAIWCIERERSRLARMKANNGK